MQLSATLILSSFVSRNNNFCFVILDKQKQSHNGQAAKFSEKLLPRGDQMDRNLEDYPVYSGHPQGDPQDDAYSKQRPVLG